MRFASRMLVVQLATQVCVVAVVAAVFLALGVQQLRAEADASALNIARTVAAAPEVRELVAAYSLDPGTPDGESLRDGRLQEYAGDVTARTEGLFVVITDDHGIRLAHPTPERLGEVVSTSFAEALAGREVVTWEIGTLGESARAKVPIFPVEGGAPIGEVSVGFERASVFDDLPALLVGVSVAVLAALALGIGAALLMRRRLEKITLGVQPEELVSLVQTQAAVLEGTGEGVIAIDSAGVIRVCNAEAARMLGAEAPLGQPWSRVALPVSVREAIRSGAPEGVVIADRVVHVDTRPVRRGAVALGTVAVLRDRTDLLALSERLDSVRALTDALRVQRHEFANRLHAAAGLLDAGRVDQARSFLGDLVGRGSVDYDLAGAEAVTDPALQSFLGAKAVSARERGVTLAVSDETLLRGRLGEVEDAVAVLGNLIDNAVFAAVGGDRTPWVEVTLLDDGDTLVLSVVDSGRGLDGDPFAPRDRGDADADAVHGHGIGLSLSRELARRRGGDVWVIQAAGDTHGAVLGARLPGVIDDSEAS